MEILGISLRTIFFYLIIILSYRIMGKREIAQLSISDLTIATLIAELVALGIEDQAISITMTLVPIGILVVLEVASSILELKINKVRDIIDGKPSLIINKGKLNIKEMERQRYSVDDLLLALRSNGLKSIDEVNYLILENNGKVSIFKKNKLFNDLNYPLPLVIDGKVEKDTLKNIKKNIGWLQDLLSEYGYTLKDILYAFYKKNKVYIIKK